MALVRGALRLQLRVCGRTLSHPCPSAGVRSLADNVLPKTGPDTASDHLLYTPEHFALKESLRKVRRSAANFDFSLKIIKINTLYEDEAQR